MTDTIRVVYRPKTHAEAMRRVERGNALLGTPFVRLPGELPGHKVAFVSSEGHVVRVKDVEMVYNDALLMDAVSNWGEDGPLYKDTLDSQVMREVFEYAVRQYAGVPLPAQLVNPRRSA